MRIILSKKEIEVLKFLDENEETILVNGGEVWYGNEITNKKILNRLLKLCLISTDDYLTKYEKSVEYYEINSDGIKAYKDGFIERDFG